MQLGTSSSRRLAAATTLAVLSAATAAHAQSTEPAETFFKGKTITLLIGGTAGGGLDTAARIFSRHAGRHIPGNPAVSIRSPEAA